MGKEKEKEKNYESKVKNKKLFHNIMSWRIFEKLFTYTISILAFAF